MQLFSYGEDSSDGETAKVTTSMVTTATVTAATKTAVMVTTMMRTTTPAMVGCMSMLRAAALCITAIIKSLDVDPLSTDQVAALLLG